MHIERLFSFKVYIEREDGVVTVAEEKAMYLLLTVIVMIFLLTFIFYIKLRHQNNKSIKN